VNVPVGTTGEWEFPVNGPGRWAGLCGRMYKGGASITRGDISETTTVGGNAETRWNLQSGTYVHRQFRLKHVMARNDRTRPLNNTLQSSSPAFGGSPATDQHYRPLCGFYIDCLTDDGREVNELGSLLDTDGPRKKGVKVSFKANVSNAATNGHALYLLGHRFLDGDKIDEWVVREQAK
jgi:hypothetical protein